MARRRRKLSKAQRRFLSYKIRLLYHEHPEWEMDQVVAVAYSYMRRRS